MVMRPLFPAFCQPSHAFVALPYVSRLAAGIYAPVHRSPVTMRSFSKKAAVLSIRQRLIAHALASGGPGISPDGYSGFYTAALSVLDAISLFFALGVVETIQRADEVSGDPSNTLEFNTFSDFTVSVDCQHYISSLFEFSFASSRSSTCFSIFFLP